MGIRTFDVLSMRTCGPGRGLFGCVIKSSLDVDDVGAKGGFFGKDFQREFRNLLIFFFFHTVTNFVAAAATRGTVVAAVERGLRHAEEFVRWGDRLFGQKNFSSTVQCGFVQFKKHAPMKRQTARISEEATDTRSPTRASLPLDHWRML